MSAAISDLLRQGKLHDAVAAATAAVRAAPVAAPPRLLLAELLLLAGDLARADTALNAAVAVDASLSPGIAEFRQLLRAETARRQVLQEGRMPEFLGRPEPHQVQALAALVALHANDAEGAAPAAEAAEAARPRCRGRHAGPGRHGDVAFDDIRDADDILAGTLEVLTTTGKLFWVPFARIERVAFDPPRRPRDLAWRRAALTVRGGPDGVVYVPSFYGPHGGDTDAHRLGHATSWSEGPGPVRGHGQRLFMLGEEAAGALELTMLTFTP